MTVRPDPEDVARRLLQREHPDAVGAFVAGSIVRGEATATSDIDLVVLYEEVGHAWRVSSVEEGWPVEVFAHDPGTLAWFFDQDARWGVPSLPSMVAEGIQIGEHRVLREARESATTLLEKGPAPWSEDALNRARYTLTDLRDDLRAPRNPAEQTAIAARMYEPLAELWLRSQRQWSAKGKSIPRRLNAVDAAFASRFTDAFAAAFTGEAEALVTLCDHVLDGVGGPLFEGYRMDAPARWRGRPPGR